MNFETMELIRRMLRYLIEGIMVGLAAYFVMYSKHKRADAEDIIIIGVTAAAVFAILDLYTPGIAAAAKTGAGFGIGANLVGFPMV